MKIRDNRKTALLLMALLAAAASGAGGQASWITFTSETGGFSVCFPGSPTETHPSIKTVVGKIGENIFELNAPEADFSVEYSDLPAIAVDFDSDDDLYARAKDNLLKVIGGSEAAFQAVTVAGRPGKELSFQIPAGEKTEAASGKTRFLLAGKRLYVITATASAASQKPGAVERFLDSFKLLKGN